MSIDCFHRCQECLGAQRSSFKRPKHVNKHFFAIKYNLFWDSHSDTYVSQTVPVGACVAIVDDADQDFGRFGVVEGYSEYGRAVLRMDDTGKTSIKHTHNLRAKMYKNKRVLFITFGMLLLSVLFIGLLLVIVCMYHSNPHPLKQSKEQTKNTAPGPKAAHFAYHFFLGDAVSSHRSKKNDACEKQGLGVLSSRWHTHKYSPKQRCLQMSWLSVGRVESYDILVRIVLQKSS